MTIENALREGLKILKEANIDTPVVEAGVILCHVLGCDRSYLYTHGNECLDENAYVRFWAGIRSRAEGVPIQHITGCQEFMSLNFHVTTNTLIPRHDTEVLVEAVIGHVKALRQKEASGNDKVRILDIGTGTGCIAISLAYYLENCHVTAMDVSEAALQVAGENAAGIGVESSISFVQQDIFSGFEGKDGYFDVIVSNPPYIPHSDIEGLQREVKEHEPVSALDGGTDGLDFYREIAGKGHRLLKQDGLLAFEVGYDQAAAVCSIMEKNFYGISVQKDFASIDRVVKGLRR